MCLENTCSTTKHTWICFIKASQTILWRTGIITPFLIISGLWIYDDTYNYIKVAKDDKEKGVRDTYITQDSSNIAKWGKLMLYEKVSTDLNDVQLAERANQLLQIKNRETETLRMECTGDVRVHGGSGVNIQIAQAGINLWAVVDSVSHEFTRTNHTMTMNLIFGRWWNGLGS